MRYLLPILFIFNCIYSQSDVPVTLRAQFNGSFGYTIIGNTHNESDNYQFTPPPPCQMLTQSSATLNLLPNQNIIAAYLYWGGIGDGTFNPIVQLNNISYSATQTFVSDPFGIGDNNYFNSFSDVTNQVLNSGNGSYILSNFNLNPIIGNYCSNSIYNSGWHLIIIYNQPTLPNVQLNIYDGNNCVSEFFNNGVTPINIGNLNIVSTQNAKMSYVALNGSPNLFLNESILFNGNILSNILNPPNNPFNGTNSFTGSTTNWNQDIDTFDISPFISVGDTQANITMKSVFSRFIQTVVTSIRSELPDATVQVSQVTGQEVCNNRNLVVNYTVSNINSNAVLPANVPVSFYANNVLLQTINTPSAVAIGGSLALNTTVAIPPSVPNTFTLKVIVDNTATNTSTVAESNETNNEFSQNVTLLGNTVNPVFSLANTFCQGAIVPTLPLISNNGISGTWLPNIISNQNSGSYVFTPNAGSCGLPFTLNVTITSSINPNFSIATTFCQGAIVPTLPLISNNGISGTWLPNVISNQTSGSYVFTPNTGSCGLPFTLNVAISPNVNPTFSIATTFCQGANVPTLPLISNNNISGTWLPNVISNQNSGSYVFTPNAGSCGLLFTLNVTISNSINPTFTLANSFCQGANVPTLPLISTNNISGTWLPNAISNQNSGSYVFTPSAGSCGLPFTLNVAISNSINPVFSLANTFCQNAIVPTLQLISNNGISGTWLPNSISNQISGSYIFTPNAGQCGLPFTLNVAISPSINPTFSLATTFCQGASVPTLPLISNNGISGTWLPNVISNQTSGNYVFTPNTGSCGLPFTLNVAISNSINPVFSLANTFCQNAIVPTLQLISNNGISGTWLPNSISNQISGSYIFTPNAGQCATNFTLNVTISPNVNPTFSIPTTFCQNAIVPTLPLLSSNGISGTWLPNVISNQTSGSYDFTPNAGSCGLPFTLNVAISPSVNPTFSIGITFCQNAIVPTLPLISNNNISGTWLPNVISNQTSGSYVFTPNAGNCGLPFTLNVTISPSINPTFSIANTFCQGASVPTLPLLSNNGISGTWLPNAISNQTSGSYVFTPNAGQCNSVFTLNVIIETADVNEETLFICEDVNGNAVFPVTLNTELNSGNYTFSWSENSVSIANNMSFLTAFSAGNYEVVASPIVSGCDIVIRFEVLPLQPITVIIAVPKPDFDANQTIVVNASGGSGQYIYSFANLPFQSNPVFNVSDGGSISVVVKDANGCYTFSETFVIWQYPRFFTPNNDSFNDTWGINTQKQITTEIFDRYGRFVKQLINNQRWDGTFNAQTLPSTDYWFVVYYDENKVYKSHFSLKR
jgi:gliding motility-associated-like protein